MNKDEIEKLIHDYLEYGRTNDPSYNWAWEEVQEKLNIDLVIRLVEACETDKDLAYVAAGPLENIIWRAPDGIRNELDTQTRKSAKMRKALKGVWESPSTKGRKLLDELLQKYGLEYGSL